MENTKIQWCDDTENPVMGCDGCELWPKHMQILGDLLAFLSARVPEEKSEIRDEVSALLGSMKPTEIWHQRVELVDELKGRFPVVRHAELLSLFKKRFRCWAGYTHTRFGGVNSGYPRIFEEPKKTPGKMITWVKKPDLRGTDRPDKPWLNGLPRTIFVSDMGDALSESIDFEYLEEEIIDNVASEAGQRHVWLWLTKRPIRMAEFATWLRDERGKEWPDNLVAMTSVTGRATRNRIDELRQVPARLRGLSVEPLIESVELDLDGIDWVIVGGESGHAAWRFDIDWARSIRDQCSEADAAFFMKQLGTTPVERGFPVHLVHSHGGDWEEWPRDLRVREMPKAFEVLPA